MTPQLIIIRVVRGHGLSADAVATTSQQISVMQFHKGVPPGTETTELPNSPMIPLRENVHAVNIAGSLSDRSFEELSKASPC